MIKAQNRTRIGAAATAMALAAALTAPFSNAQEKPDAQQLQAIAEEAYLYGFPMIVGYSALHSFFIDESSPQFKAPINQLKSEARVFTPADTAAAAPNSDTPYSMAMLDLRAEPMVLCVPDVDEDRFYDVQLVDLYTFNYGYIGSRTTGNDAGCYLVIGPDWQEEKVDGIAGVYRSETQFNFAIYRTQLFNAADMDNVKKIQAGYRLQPLSEFLGRPAPPAAPAVDWPAFSKEAPSTRFGEYLSFLLQFCPPTGDAAVEKALRERFAGIGITPGGTVPPKEPSAEVQAAIGAGIKAALSKIDKAAANIGTPVNGWRIGSAGGTREWIAGNWTHRAAVAKLGIFGNSEAEAVYPLTTNDANGIPLDGSRNSYQMTFKAGELPPVNAFWSITMYDGSTKLLIDNPIDRYLINSPMLDQLKKNPDDSLTIYVQKDSPGKEKESNWLPAPTGSMYVVMRLYWPKTGEPSIYPIGKGSWTPPPLVPTQHLGQRGARRFGDKSVENIVRTDTRYGHDPLLDGPRGWDYWRDLEYPRPIQEPNLWPDNQSTYFIGKLRMPPGASLILHYEYPHARYFQFALYTWKNNTFVSTGEALAGKRIEPDPGSTNPFRVGADRLAEQRRFTLTVLAEDAPADPKDRVPNTLYAASKGDLLQIATRTYLSDQGWDGAGWGPSSKPAAKTGFPTYEGRLADGTKLSAEEVVEQFGVPMEGNIKPPVTPEQWIKLVNSPKNDPTLDPATAPARAEPRWEKFWNTHYSILGAFETPEDRAKIPWQGSLEGDPTTQYFFLFLSRKFGPVYVTQGKMPTFPDTYAGAGGQGLEIMPDAQARYWSLVSGEASASSGHIVDGVSDMQVPLDAECNYTIVVSRPEDRPANATPENGVVWIEWPPRGEGLSGPKNRQDLGILEMRFMATNTDWKERPDNITEPGMEEAVMGPYYPRGYYATKAEFEAQGPRK